MFRRAALRNVLPDPAYLGLAGQLPAEVGLVVTDRRHHTGSAQQLIRDVADELHVSEPDAAFYTRVTLEQLNAYCRGTTPAGLAASLPADLRPLMSARAEDPALRHRYLVRRLSSAVTNLSLGAPVRLDEEPADRPAVAARRQRHHAS
ncbi:DUF2267 domain-containing protein [Actinoplanes sp. CA-051413]|uniref:DUF2267 domain-containing protein n=1 Tax=Actinoplanes sp. CA-051413 TaxID=3239899 RepID=UPI003D951FD9